MASACRHVWNHFVDKLKDDYTYYGRCDDRWRNNYKLFTMLRNGQKDWLKAYSFTIVRQIVKPIETTYQQFFKGQGRLPKFHGRYTTAPTFTCPQGAFKQVSKSLHIAKIGQVSLSGLNPYPASKLVQVVVKAALNVLAFGNGATACGGGVDVKRPVKREMDRGGGGGGGGVGFISQSV